MSIARWVALCESVGISTRNLNPMDCFSFGGSIVRDLKGREVSDLTPDEKLAIRDHALGVVTMRTK